MFMLIPNVNYNDALFSIHRLSFYFIFTFALLLLIFQSVQPFHFGQGCFV